jgi:colanic acid/amylovoran biosynthesis glycosyltransferase
VRVAYVMSRFPKLTETFVLNEILAVQAIGIDTRLYPLLRGNDPVVQPGAGELVARATYVPLMSLSILASQLHFLRRRPGPYLRSLFDLVRDLLGGKPKALVGALVLFPKIVHIARLMAHAGIDHVHCHFARHATVAGLVIQRLTDIPYSFTAHGSDVHVDRHMLCRKLGEASFGLTISEFNRQVIEKECGPQSPDKLHVLYCGVDTQVFSPSEAPLPPPSGGLRIVCVGTLHEVKGQAYLIEACALLRDMGVQFSCRFIGRGRDEPMLRRLISRHGLDDSVTLVGALARDAVIGELRNADVLVAPSVISARGQREGIPVVLMEAMSCGLPVVSSRLSGIPELVRDDANGLLVTPGSAPELAEALRRVATDPALRQRLGSEGRKTIERDFDLRTNAGRLVRLFEAAIAS